MEREKKYNYVRNTFSWDGKRYDVKGKTIEEVYKKIAKMKVSLERGEIVINANTTVDHWFKEWVETYKNAAGLTPKSLKMYDEKYRNYIQPVIGAMKLRDVRDPPAKDSERSGRTILFACVKDSSGAQRDVFSCQENKNYHL